MFLNEANERKGINLKYHGQRDASLYRIMMCDRRELKSLDWAIHPAVIISHHNVAAKTLAAENKSHQVRAEERDDGDGVYPC